MQRTELGDAGETELRDVLGEIALQEQKALRIEQWLKDTTRRIRLVADAMEDTSTMARPVTLHMPAIAVSKSQTFDLRTRVGGNRISEDYLEIAYPSYQEIGDQVGRLTEAIGTIANLNEQRKKIESSAGE